MIKFFKTITDNNLKIFRKPVIASIFKSLFQGQPVLVILMVMLELLQPLIDPGTELNIKKLIMLCIWLLVSLVMLFFLLVIVYKSSAVSFKLAAKGRLKLGDHLRNLSMGFFKSKDPGDLTSLMLADYTNFENYLGMLLMDALASISLPVIFLIFLLPLDWRMALITLAPVPAAIIAAIFTNAVIITRTGKKHIKANNETTSRMLEYLDGIKNIKAFNLHGEKFERLQKSFKELKKISIKQEALGGPLAMLGIWCLKAGIALIMVVGISFVVNGTLSLPYFLFFLILGTRVYDPLSSFMVLFLEMCYFSISVKRLREIHETPPMPSPKEAPAPTAWDIEFDNVRFHYHETDVLKDVSFKLPENSMTALVGPSGSGKSTITRLIARFWDVNNGQVKIGGKAVSEYRTEDLLAQVSMVFQDVYLFNDTILNNIKVGRAEATMDDVLAAAEKACCREFIEKLPDGFDTMVGEGGSTLSGGEKQRISIARALLKNAPIILLDEATASLDPENELYIQKAIGELIKDKTLVVIAHRLSTITHANQILVLKNGGIAERGTHDELLSSGGVYAGMWNEQKYAHNWKVGSTEKAGVTG